MTTTRRPRRALRVTGIVAAGLVAATVGSYAVVRAIPAEFPLLYSERLDPATTESIEIADPAVALTFARVQTTTGPTVLAVTDYSSSTISGIDVNAAAGTAFADPITAFDGLGYAAIEGIAGDAALPRVDAAADEVLTSLVTHTRHIGMGTNYAEHQAEGGLDEVFMFPKIGAITDSAEELPQGSDGLLDYEVELGLVALHDVTPESGTPEHMGLVLSNDYTDRELLLNETDVSDVASGKGFTDAKSQPGFLSTGDLFVIPADWQQYYKDLQLDLYVNGDLRQSADPSDLIWDGPTMLKKVFEAGDRTWQSDGEPVAMTVDDGIITRGTILQTGTPEGVVFRAPDTRARFLGFLEYVGSLGTNAESIVDSAVQVYIRDSEEAGVYLQAGDEIVTRADGLGQITTTIVAGDRATTE